MSGVEILAVVGCVAAVVSAYHDGYDLVREIKERRRVRKALRDGSMQDPSTQDLELSLSRGQEVVRSQYERDYKRLGDSFATGDQIARDTLKDIIIHLQGQLIANLKIAWQQDTQVDFLPLQDVSDESQDRAIMCLMQLHQRLLIAAPIQEIRTSPTYHQTIPRGYVEPMTPPSTRRESWNTISTIPSPMRPTSRASTGSFEREKRKQNKFAPMFRRPKNNEGHQPQITDTSNQAQNMHPIAIPLKYNPYDGARSMYSVSPQDSAFIHDTGSRISSISSHESDGAAMQPDHPEFNPWSGAPPVPRKHSESSVNPPYATFTPDSYPARTSSFNAPPHRNLSYGDTYNSRANSSARVPNTNQNSYPPQRPAIPSAQASLSFQPTPSRQVYSPTAHMQGSNGQASSQTLTQTISSTKGFLPSERNNFAGLCKGAWRLQIGERKKAMEERSRPTSLYSAMSYWKCSKCSFEGRMTKDANGKKSIDMRVLRFQGLLYRWEFLFKSHVQLKDAPTNPSESAFGCVFCCAEGKGTPTFGGVANFLEHLQEHRYRPPVGEILYRMGCIVGRTPDATEEFDIAFLPQ